MPLKYLIPLLTIVGILYVILMFVAPRLTITIAIMALGFSLVWKTSWWIELFGRNPWAEEHLTSGLGSGAGGSWLFYKLLGIVIMVAAFLYFTGGLQGGLVRYLGIFFRSGVND